LRKIAILSALMLALTAPLAASADDRVPLWEDAELESGLRMIARGGFVKKNCKAVSTRQFRTYGFMYSLVERGRSLGYSDDEMRAYIKDKGQKARVEALAKADLEARGVDFDDPDSFCDLARTEIAADRDFGHYFTIR